MVSFTWKEETFILHPSRCLYWEKEQALVLSDLHLGKTGHFRKEGIAVPQQVYREDLQRLFDTIQFFRPKEVLLAGDLFHSRANKEWDWFAKWRNDFSSVGFTLILGNHDTFASDVADKMQMTVVPELERNKILFVHHAAGTDTAAAQFKGLISGHIHPAIMVPTGIRQSARLPCFHFSGHTCTLPAFSLFSGMHTIKPRAGDHIFAIADSKIIKI